MYIPCIYGYRGSQLSLGDVDAADATSFDFFDFFSIFGTKNRFSGGGEGLGLKKPQNNQKRAQKGTKGGQR